MSAATQRRPAVSTSRDQAPRRARAARPLSLVAERRRSVRRSAAAASVVLVALLFGALVMWVSVITGQGRLDDLRSSIASEQERHAELVTAETEMKSPDEILRIAEEELHMTEPARSELVTPMPGVIAPHSTDPGGG